MRDRDASLVLLLLVLVAGDRRRARGGTGSARRSGPWWPGPDEDNLGTMPVPPDAHPEPQLPPLK